MDLNDVCDQVAARLKTLDGVRVYDHPTDQVTVPAAVVPVPEDITYDATYGRGMDRITLPVILVVARVSNRAARQKVGEFASGSGERSIKAVLESGTYTAFDDIRVSRADFDVVTVGTADYLAAVFTCDIAGRGSS